jgi:acyl carrier protein
VTADHPDLQRPGDVLDRVMAIVATVAGPDRVPAGATPDTALGADGFWLDSVDVLEVILACEREFGTPLDQDDHLTAEALHDVRSLSETIRRKLG